MREGTRGSAPQPRSLGNAKVCQVFEFPCGRTLIAVDAGRIQARAVVDQVELRWLLEDKLLSIL